jgi:GTP cyclohydrolase II
MKHALQYLLATAIILFCGNHLAQSMLLPTCYPLVLEKLIFFKTNMFKVFYGGPINKKDSGAQWIMPIVFESTEQKTRAVYEVTFINCNPTTAKDAEVLFIEASDIDIKFKNTLSSNYKLFSSLINGKYKNGKYIIVRATDVAVVFFPDIFVSSVYGTQQESDKYEITQFLNAQFATNTDYSTIETERKKNIILYENCKEIVYEPIYVCIDFETESHFFTVEKRIRKNDIWKIYYIVYKTIIAQENIDTSELNRLLRIDSGCVSGQIYDDTSCDCLDQLHDALKQIAYDPHSQGIIIHIPGHDGRGFGTAPKAETEIYKIGGCGRVHSTCPLDTIAAAKLLYGTETYDLRSFNGTAELLSDMNISKVILLTDNVAKVHGLTNNGIEVIRQKTDTNKTTCLDHLQAKKNSSLYFSE